MKRLIFIYSFIIITTFAFAQNIDFVTNNGQTISTCSSAFTIGSYQLNTPYQVTVCSDDPLNHHVSLFVSSYNFPAGMSILIYDGATTSDSLLNTWNSNVSAGTIGAQATVANTSGCLTFVFTSSVAGASLSGTLSCTFQCPSRTVDIISSTPAMIFEDSINYVNLCWDYANGHSDTLTLTAQGTYPTNVGYDLNDSTVMYDWDWRDGSAVESGLGLTNGSHVFNEQRAYKMYLTTTDSQGCTYTGIPLIVRISPTPIWGVCSTSPSDICLGEMTTVIANFLDTNIWTNTIVPEMTDCVPLPDGNGVCYNSVLAQNQFDPGQTLNSISDLIAIHFSFTHSYIGDLTMRIYCPNGQNVLMYNQGGGPNYFTTTTEICSCPSSVAVTEYGFSPTSTQIIDYHVTGDYYEVLPGGNYASFNPLTGLIGCPLNGNWNFEVCDMWGSDCGINNGWWIEFNSSLFPEPISYNTQYTIDSWTGATGVELPSNLINDTITATYTTTVTPNVQSQQPFTIHLLDDMGCYHDTTLNLNVRAISDPTCCIQYYDQGFDIAITGNGATYTPGSVYCGNIIDLSAPPLHGPNNTGLWTSINNTTGTVSSLTSNPDITINIGNNYGQYTFIWQEFFWGLSSCVTADTVTITMAQTTQPTFASVQTNYCFGSAIPDLPLQSDEGITGTWSPAINNTETTTYTFVPATGQYANTTTLTITINQLPQTPIVTIDCSLGENNGSVEVVSPVGPNYQYSLDDGPFQSSNIFTNLVNNNYIVRVKENSCLSLGSNINLSCGCTSPSSISLQATTGTTDAITAFTLSENTFTNATTVFFSHNGNGYFLANSSSSTPFSFTYVPDNLDEGNVVKITISTNDSSDPSCIAAIENFYLTINSMPSDPDYVFASQSTICYGSSTNLSYLGGSGDSFVWYENSCGTNQIGTGNNFQVSPTQTTTYYGRWENAFGVSDCMQVTINVIPNPTDAIMLTATQTTVCENTAVTILALGGSGDTFVWYNDANASNQIGIGTSLQVTPSQTTTYYGRWENSCSQSPNMSSIEIEVNMLPTDPISLNSNYSEICYGEYVTLTYNGGDGDVFAWYSDANASILLEYGDNLNIQILEDTNIYGRWESACGNSTLENVTIQVKDSVQDPTSLTATPQTIDEGDSSVLSYTDGSGHTFSWYSDSTCTNLLATGNNYSVSPTLTTTYYGRWENECGNSEILSVVVTVNPTIIIEYPIPADTVIANNYTICEGNTVTLSYFGGFGDSFAWYEVGCGTNIVGSGNNLQVSPTQTTTYYGRWENTAGNSTCLSITITVQEVPTLNLNDITVCEGPILLPAPEGYSNYQWVDANNQTVNGLVSESGNYTVSVNSGVCVAQQTISVSINGVIDLQLSSTPSSSNIASDGSATVDAENIESCDILWSTGESSATIFNLGSGIYAVTVSLGECQVIDTIFVAYLTDIEEEIADEISVYPNPNDGEFYIDFGHIEDANSYQLIDAKGSVVLESKISNKIEKISVDVLPGNYYIKINCDNRSIGKLITIK